jgi:parallel beta-helix repeat protein
MRATTLSGALAIAITVVMLLSSAFASAAESSATPARPAEGPTAPSGPTHYGGPQPTSGPETCPGATPYTTAQIVILPNGVVAPTGAPVQVAGGLYTLQDPVDTSVLVLASGVTVDGSDCLLTYTTVGTTTGNHTGVQVRNATNVTLEYFDVAPATAWDGIAVDYSSAVSVYHSSAQSASDVGLYAYESKNVNFTDNSVNDSYMGVWFEDVEDGLAEGNQAVGTGDTPLYSEVTTDVSYIDNDGPGARYYGAYLDEDVGSVLLDNNLSHVYTDEYGLYDYGSSGALIQGNDFVGTPAYGAYVYEPFGAVTLDDNDFSGGAGDGIYVEDSYTGTYVNLVGNDVRNTTSIAVDLYEDGAVNVTGNDLALNHTKADTYGVYVYYAYGTTVIHDNNLTGGFEYGVYLETDGGAQVVTGNNIANTTDEAIDDVYSEALTIADNDLSVNKTTSGDGIYVDDAAGGGPSVVEGNNLTGGWEYGVYFYETYAPFTITNNDFVGYTDVGVDVYYGYASLRVVGNDMAANRTSELHYPYGVYLGYYLFGSLTVSDNNLSNLAYGLYTADAIYGNLTFDGNRILNSSDGGLYDDDYVYGAVSVENNTFSASPTTTSAYGLYVSYAYGPEAFTGNQVTAAGYGILAYGSSGPTTVSGNTVTDPVDEGLKLEDAYAGLSVANNSVTGNNSVYSATAEGVFVEDPGGGSLTTISNNTLSGGLEYGLYFEEGWSPTNVVQGNTVRDTVKYGVYVYDAQAPTFVLENTVSGARGYALYIDDCAALTVEGNLLQGSNVSLALDSNYVSLMVAGNNASGSNVSLELEDSDSGLPAVVEANNFSSSKAAYVNETDGALIGNDFLGTAHLDLEDDVITAFYHNDVDTSAGADLNLSGTVPWGGVFNAALPVGGNFWTGYVPTSCTNDICSPAYSVPNGTHASGYLDEYPLGHAWASYAITFAESGLPAGSVWSVVFDGTTTTAVSPEAVAVYPQNIAPVSYSYRIAGVGTYTLVSPSSGTVTASGKSTTIAVTFARPTYRVSFSETGLAKGVVWYVSSSGSPGFSSQAFSVSGTPSETFSLGALPNGTYAFTVGVVQTGYTTVTPVSATFTVDGATVTVSYTYTYSGPPIKPASSSNTTTDELYGLAAGLGVAAVLAIVGWMLYLSRRGKGGTGRPPVKESPPPGVSSPPPPPPPT